MIQPVDPTTRVHIGKVTLEVPVYRDPETSARIAREISERIEDIGARSTTVNALHFALLAAYEIACELDALRQEKEKDDAETAKRLQNLHTALRQLTIYAQELSPEPDSEA
ncbi:MAG TPA: cell division protein ZapA [Candidatus Hydrogenedentes bacterium]|nr:cell division protein ZapA [Candidatus Hydrogenedentota bacterium]